MLRYKANVTVNIRSTPAVTSTNDIGDIPAGTEFICEDYMVTGVDGNKYVSLISVGGFNKSGYVSTKANITLLGNTTTPPTDPQPVPTFPESFILENPKTGERAEYVFVRVLP